MITVGEITTLDPDDKKEPVAPRLFRRARGRVKKFMRGWIPKREDERIRFFGPLHTWRRSRWDGWYLTSLCLLTAPWGVRFPRNHRDLLLYCTDDSERTGAQLYTLSGYRNGDLPIAYVTPEGKLIRNGELWGRLINLELVAPYAGPGLAQLEAARSAGLAARRAWGDLDPSLEKCPEVDTLREIDRAERDALDAELDRSLERPRIHRRKPANADMLFGSVIRAA